MKIDIKVILIGLAMYFGIKYKDNIKIPLNFNNQQTIVQTKERNVSEPSQSYKDAGKDIIKIFNESKTTRDKKKDAFAIGDFYGDFNKVFVTPANVIKTNSDLKATLELAGKSHFQTVGIAKEDYDGLQTAIDNFLASQIGLQNTVLDTEKTAKALSALQWIFYEAAK